MKICTILKNHKHSNPLSNCLLFLWKKKWTEIMFLFLTLWMKIQIEKFCYEISRKLHQNLSIVIWKKKPCFFPRIIIFSQPFIMNNFNHIEKLKELHIFVCFCCHNKIPETRWLKKTEIYFSQFCRLRIQDQSVGKFAFF